MNKLNYFSLLLCLLVFSFAASSQGSNSLAFDGSNDVAIVPNASAQIANSPGGMSISCWVYATNPAPNYPNFDGIVGFRNDASCDFYLLHLTTTSVEARFRNSSGTDYTPVITGFQINTWQHLVMTYDGSTLKTYLNGVPNASLPASGSISLTNQSFHIGYLPFSPSSFQFGGKLDEVGLWDKALTPAEINCMYNYGHDNSSPNLKLSYKCDQGSANGNNSSITKLTDDKGNIDGNLNGFSMSGSSSNFTQGKVLSGTTSATLCKGDSVQFGNAYYSQPGIYYATFSTAGSCDSIAQITLTMDSVDTHVFWVNGTELRARESGATYQWIDCDTKLPLQGHTRQNYRPTTSGHFAVVVTKNGCTDTSDCFTSSIGLPENNLPQLSIFPNPSKGSFTFSQGMDTEAGTLLVLNAAGKTVAQIAIENRPETVIDLKLLSGVYTLSFQRKDGKSGTSSLIIAP